MFKEDNYCANHQNSKFLFYCFDDKLYLCEECFREHKSHNVEIKADIKKVFNFVQSLKKSNSKNIKKNYEDIEKNLLALKEKIEGLLSEVKKISEKFKDNEEIKIQDDIINIKFEEFENLLTCINVKSKAHEISDNCIEFLNKINSNFQIIPYDFKYINKEVSVVNNSEIYRDFTIDILLGKSTRYAYTLFNQNKEHFLIVDLNKKYYLNSIRIQVDKNDCTLKNFIVYIKETNDDNENWLKVNDFIRKKENEDNHFQSFNIGYFCRQVKFIFKDAWGTNNGNYILINKIDFEVGE